MLNVTSIYLNGDTLRTTDGSYGLVSMYVKPDFSEQYLSKEMLVREMQSWLNAIAEEVVSLPPEADRVEVTAKWKMMKAVLDNVSSL